MARHSRRKRRQPPVASATAQSSSRPRQGARWQRLLLIVLLAGLVIGGVAWHILSWQHRHALLMSREGEAPANSGNHIADAIADGHAFDKHLVEEDQWAAQGINSRRQFALFLQHIIEHPSEERDLSGGRIAYWDNASGTVIIYNPGASDCGTAFQPNNGYRYFYNLR